MTADARMVALLKELGKQGVTDMAVLAAMESVPRERFVPEVFRDRAYENTALPIGEGQTISQPLIVGLMTQALAVTEQHRVLEIGTGSGYQAAVLARLCRRVYTIERIAALAEQAERVLQELKIRNVTFRVGDGTKGWPEQAPFERIIVTAAAQHTPGTLIEQLAAGGRMVIPVGASRFDQDLLLLEKSDGGVTETVLSPVRFVPLIPDLDTDGRPDGRRKRKIR